MDDILEIPVELAADADADALVTAAAEGGEALSAIASMADAGATAATSALEAGAAGEAAAEAGTEAVAVAAEATAAGTSAVPVVGLIISAASLVLAATATLLGFMFKSKRITMLITNKTPYLLEINSVFMAHGKQTGTIMGNSLQPAAGGQVAVGRLEFSKDNMALIGTMGTVIFDIENSTDGSYHDQVFLGWEVPENGHPRGAIALNFQGSGQDFYNKYIDSGPAEISGSATNERLLAQFAMTGEDNGASTMSIAISQVS